MGSDVFLSLDYMLHLEISYWHYMLLN